MRHETGQDHAIDLDAGLASTNAALALSTPRPCRGPTATNTTIEGLDTPPSSRRRGVHLPDAISHCHYELGRRRGSRSDPRPDRAVRPRLPSGYGTQRCRVTAEANCKAGDIGIPDLKPANTQKLPLDNSCAEGGEQAVRLFQVPMPRL